MRILADIVLTVHAGIALFIVGALIGIWVGGWRHWSWVRNRRFRQVHFAAIGFVAITSTIGWACPLTVLEDWLRGAPAVQPGFIQRWVGAFLYYDLPASVFTGVYLIFALLVAATWYFLPPARPEVP